MCSVHRLSICQGLRCSSCTLSIPAPSRAQRSSFGNTCTVINRSCSEARARVAGALAAGARSTCAPGPRRPSPSPHCRCMLPPEACVRALVLTLDAPCGQVHGPNAFCDKWLEPPALWQHTEPTPDVVNDRSLLVVNGRRVRLPLGQLMSLLRPDVSGVTASFYADGANNLAHSFPFLAPDFAPPPVASLLDLKRCDIWLGGRSTSRMHDDNLDNLFVQVVGSKTFVLAPPAAGAPLVDGRLRK